MFQVGDKVFYPMHGAGVIEAIEEREIQGEIREYYLITIPSSNLDIMIPMNTVSKTGVRSVVDRKTLKDILHDFHNVASDCELPWRQRFNTNTEKLKSGETNEVAEVVRDLLYRNNDKPLNASERQMLNSAQKILISELTLIKGITEDEATDLLTITNYH